jgi:hypothetical protein
VPLIQKMTTLRARLSKIPVRFGVPSYRNVLIRHVELESDLTEHHTDEVFANVKVTTVPPRYVGLSVGGRNDGITIAQNDFKAEIPREYSREFIEKDVLYFVIDPPMVDGEVLYSGNEPAGGIFCKLVTIDDKEDTLWILILRKVRDTPDPSIDGEVGY